MQSFIIHPDGSLSAPQDTVSSTGDRPAFVAALSTGQVGVMNFDGGSGLFIPTIGSPLHFERNAPAITFPTKPNTVSHPHMLLQHGEEVFVPDLVSPAPCSLTLILTRIKGQDTIWRLVQHGSNPGSFIIQGSISQPAGSGPRHIAIFGKFTPLSSVSRTTSADISWLMDRGQVVYFTRNCVNIIRPGSTSSAKWNFRNPFRCLNSSC